MSSQIAKKQQLLGEGIALMRRWCNLNKIEQPAVHTEDGDPTAFGVCAYYRDGHIYIKVAACASPSPAQIGAGGRAWSYPGHTIDRTPYGVVCHELAHHIDKAHGAAGGLYGRAWRQSTGEKPITGYCPNDNEWFAEMFRVFVTNPTLLGSVRPRTYALMAAQWQSAETRHWQVVLAGADRQIAVLRKQIALVEKENSKRKQLDI